MNNCNNHCVCEDSKNNTFACIVQISKMENMKYCEFIDLQNSVEIYDLKSDPAELNNLYQTWQTTDPKKIASLERQLQYLATCSGEACHSVPT